MDFFKVKSKEEISTLSFEEIKVQRNKAIGLVAIIMIPAAALSILAIWFEWSSFLQPAMLVAMIICAPYIISTSRLSARYHELRGNKNL